MLFETFNSIKLVTFPCVIADTKVNIRIPLWFSKISIKRAGMVLDLKNNLTNVFGKSLKLNCTSIRYYVLPLYKAPNLENIKHVLVEV